MVVCTLKPVDEQFHVSDRMILGWWDVWFGSVVECNGDKDHLLVLCCTHLHQLIAKKRLMRWKSKWISYLLYIYYIYIYQKPYVTWQFYISSMHQTPRVDLSVCYVLMVLSFSPWQQQNRSSALFDVSQRRAVLFIFTLIISLWISRVLDTACSLLQGWLRAFTENQYLLFIGQTGAISHVFQEFCWGVCTYYNLYNINIINKLWWRL